MLYSNLQKCNKEIEVSDRFCKYFKFGLRTLGNIDSYSSEMLYEFKCDRCFTNTLSLAKTVAQIVYYLHQLKYGLLKSDSINYVIPPRFCGFSKNSAFIGKSKSFTDFYDSNKYDWERAASTPDSNLVNDILSFLNKKNNIITVYDLSNEVLESKFIEDLKKYTGQENLFDTEEFCKKKITSDNFIEVFDYWTKQFSSSLDLKKYRLQDFFIADIQNGQYIKNRGVILSINNRLEEIHIPEKRYNDFWNMFDKISNNEYISINQFADRLIETQRRKFEGNFYTPLLFANKGIEYIEKTLGKNFWESGDYRLWDMCAGTGNLEFKIPDSVLKYCYISTLDNNEVEYCKTIFGSATCFQYDYLNDDICSNGIEYSKLPKNLQDDLKNPNIKWIIFINPPYATANNVGEGVSDTNIRKLMEQDGLKESSRELYIQFLYRINKEFPENTHLCMYSTLKYINSTNDQKIRDTFFDYTYKKGFVFSVGCFYKSSGRFLVAFSIWDKSKHKKLSEQNIVFDCCDNNGFKIGTKTVKSINKENLLNQWFKREKNEIIMPPYKSALQDGFENKDTRNRVAKGFLGSICAKGNDIQNQKWWCVLSTPNVSAGSYSVTRDNFEKSIIAHTVRILPQESIYNNRDAFCVPNVNEFPKWFILDCLVYSIFSDSNNTVSLSDIMYNNSNYRIINNFYPYILDDIKKWDCNGFIALSIQKSNENRFVANYLDGKHLTDEAEDVFNKGKILYQMFYNNFNNIDSGKYKIKDWDAGWYQIKQSLTDFLGKDFQELKDLKIAHKKLRDKLLPKVYQYGFLDKEIDLYE